MVRYAIGVVVAGLLVVGCGSDGAGSIEGSAGSIEGSAEDVTAVVDEVRALVGEVDKLADELAESGPLGLANPQLGYDRAARVSVLAELDAAIASGDWEQVRRRRAAQLRVASAADHSPVELVEWARDRLRAERDRLRERIDARQVGR